MLRRLYAGVLAGALLFAVTGCDDDEEGLGPEPETEFVATLTGEAERPDPVTTDAAGTAAVVIDESNSTIQFNITVSGLTDATLAHIHTGGVDEAGPPVVILLGTQITGTIDGVLVSGTVEATDITGETFASLVEKIRAGNAYINVHTVLYPAGEIRGQLVANDDTP